MVISNEALLNTLTVLYLNVPLTSTTQQQNTHLAKISDLQELFCLL